MLYLKNIEMLVTEFNEELQDWSGNTFSKGSMDYDVKVENSTPQAIKEAIAEVALPDIKPEDICIRVYNGLIEYSQTENGDAEYDENGKYLVDYSFRLYCEFSVPNGEF